MHNACVWEDTNKEFEFHLEFTGFRLVDNLWEWVQQALDVCVRT